ncbi:hypothetical protein ACLOJK_004765 [Asimina triloba]
MAVDDTTDPTDSSWLLWIRHWVDDRDHGQAAMAAVASSAMAAPFRSHPPPSTAGAPVRSAPPLPSRSTTPPRLRPADHQLYSGSVKIPKSASFSGPPNRRHQVHQQMIPFSFPAGSTLSKYGTIPIIFLGSGIERKPMPNLATRAAIDTHPGRVDKARIGASSAVLSTIIRSGMRCGPSVH